ncbi:2OG-Fe dioxygenase family protein [Lysobacter brunescens]|uniref:2OG-Fe dioxygenase family protein n=1 Tax=Lysobacter brunescens TaxID=262323 RepID=A0ABW2Y9U1_9GAMM
MVATFPAPYTPPEALLADLRTRGYAVLPPRDVHALCGITAEALGSLAASWNDLPPDEYLRDGGRYRSRRHACFTVTADGVTRAPHRAHYQPVDYNALHGGIQRWFAPVDDAVATGEGWRAMLASLGACLREVRPVDAWYVEAHQFRIDTRDGIGRPTPEGAHRDGVDFVAVFLVDRHAIRGGETRVFQADGPDGQRFTLTEPWSLLLLDDTRVIHESTPIQPLAGREDGGHRDTLVLTFRAGGFQAEG